MQEIDNLRREAELWCRLRFEQDGREYNITSFTSEKLCGLIEDLKNSEKIQNEEPSDWEQIAALCDFPTQKSVPDRIKSRLAGALAGRFAGCTLGVLVEGWQVDRMEKHAAKDGTPFPPTEYWHTAENPEGVQYGVDKRTNYTLKGITRVPVDDDVTYTVLNLLLLEKYGLNYTTEDVAELWKQVVPYACTAEDCALKRIREGVSGKHAAEGNAFVEWSGAAIRADAFGYVCAGDPAAAAKLSYADAYLTHRRNGIYGEMYYAAMIAAAFTNAPLEAAKLAAGCIPRSCRLKKDIDWAFSLEGKFKDYRGAREFLDERFKGMNSVHIENNVCATIFALMLGEGDYTKSIANSVAMGLDNDCNAATVGSVAGAHAGIEGIDKKWYEPFNGRVGTYIKGHEECSLQDLTERFFKIYNDKGENT